MPEEKNIKNKEIRKLPASTKYYEYFAIGLVQVITAFVFLILFLVLGKIFYEGAGIIDYQFLTEAPRNNMTEGGIGPAIFGTVSVMFLMIIFAVPIGVFSAVYINEYAEDNLAQRVIRASVNNLAGVPSIVFGLFGLGFFVLFIGKNFDEVMGTGLLLGQPAMLWASATLAVLVLPTIIISTIEALNAVPHSQRAAAYGLGATKWQTIKGVVLPQSRSGILTGIILAVSRGAGETAPVLFLGCAFFLPQLPVAYLDLGLFAVPFINPAEQFMYLSYHIFILATQSSNPTLTMPVQFGTAAVLITLTVLLNITAVIFRFKFRRTLQVVREN
ncbi:MAG: phosphate ABC transporter permease PstA [Melioribacteraceae bacterium]|nr:phosphate ABC transporter permease PstA [Melioribacteraceae bacterium]MCF8353337.1 phosphate ABC transporter permease PstA [Melioribacteraceae bacterium]MCF8393201.1 phosphate ABC transporter permease PstA [Melioribacteraceae bacterium]MCF8419063.1 phosphate ABC transporter permease PstA [Melioribacteraceae bacterium]